MCNFYHWWYFNWGGPGPPGPPLATPMFEAAAYYLPQKRAPFFALFYKTRANTQQVLPVQTG